MIYVSSKLRHRDLWLSSPLPISASWIYGTELPPEECSGMWDRYRDDVESSQALLLYLEEGDVLKGAILEMGIAFGVNIPIVIVWNGTMADLAGIVGTIVYHQSVTVFSTMDEAELSLLSIIDNSVYPFAASSFDNPKNVP